MKLFSNIQAQFIAIILIVLVGLLIANTVLFSHSHRLADGRIISHAHPFNKTSDSDPFQEHSHSSHELVFLANMTFFISGLFLVVFARFIISIEAINSFNQVHNQNHRTTIPPLRGPPFPAIRIS